MENKNIKRIKEMEALFDEIKEGITAFGLTQDDFKKIKNKAKILETYYNSKDFMEDLDLDREGKLPQDLKRGILSEDGIWNLLMELDEYEKTMFKK